MADDIEISPNTHDFWKAEVEYLKQVMYSRCLVLTEKLADIAIDYEIPDSVIQSVFVDIGFIAGLLEKDYGFDGTVN